MDTTIDITRWINQQKIGWVQVAVLLLSGACALLEGFDALNIAFVAPAVVRDWHLPPHSFTPAFMAGLAGLLVGCLFIAPLADKFGRKRVMLGSVVAFAIFSALSAAAWSLTSLSILRFLTGVGVGGGMANAIALTSEFFPERKRASMTVIMFVGFPLGGAAGGFLSAYLIPQFGWQSVFLVGAIVPLVVALGLAFVLPESIRHLVVNEASPERVIAVLRRINPTALFVPETRFVIAEESKTGFTVGHLFRQGRAAGTVLLWVVFFMSLLDLFLVTSWLPIVLHSAGLTIAMAAVVAATLNLSGVAACIVVAPVLERHGLFVIALPAFLIAAIGIAALGSVGIGLASILIASGVAGVGIVVGQNAANALAAAYYPTYIRATGVGWALGIGRIGAVIGPAIGGAMLSLHWSLPKLYLVSAIPDVIAFAAVLVLLRLEHGRASLRAELPRSA